MVARRKRTHFYSRPEKVVGCEILFAPSFSFSTAEILPAAGAMGPGNLPRNYDVLPDGTRFIGREIAEDEESRAGAPERVQVVTNALGEIRRR